MTAFLSNIFGTVLDLIFGLTGSYGVAIVVMALLIVLITYPLNLRQMQFSYKMRAITPMTEKIKEKYGNNQEKINEETLKLWQRYGISPLAGCLPTLVQFPIFIAMFGLLRQPGSFGSNPTFLGINLVLPNAENTFWSLLKVNPVYALVPILAVVTTALHTRMTAAKSTDQSMKMMTIMMPMMMGYFSITLPSAIGIYWIARNVFTMGQQYLFERHMEKHFVLEEGDSDDPKRGKAR
ncbi:MAG: YidC/Oxa1 family membrane protein insertase [Bacillota bacterium]|jgi:YidC/Oxa1 family membrane protein insertase